ncbi:MAG: hypothetical protein NTX25_04775 [Proteobacteria bacterium]|nr:hypothetical protein [Pseudomonadota bacterium]
MVKLLRLVGLCLFQLFTNLAYGQSIIPVSVSSFDSRQHNAFQNSLRLLGQDKGAKDFKSDAEQILRAMGLNPTISVESKSQKPMGLVNLSPLASSYEFKFFVSGMPLCQFQVKAHDSGDGVTLILGEMPGLEAPSSLSADSWQSETFMDRRTRAALEQERPGLTYQKLAAERCLWLEQDRYSPVWVYSVDLDGHLYRVVLDDSKIYEQEPLQFHNSTLDWFRSIGFDDFGTNRIKIALHTHIDGNLNSAFYEPKPNDPTIYLGDGDGYRLQNLAMDSDVVAHEFAHHVIYSSIKKLKGESLILHEGLADFFSFARTGDACLAESICVASDLDENLCTRPLKCFRTAQNDWIIGDEDYLLASPHQKSQVVSGFLWDLYEKDGISLDKLAKLNLSALGFMVADSGFKHFILTLMLADRSINSGEACQKILNRAIDRGFESYLHGITCEKVAAISPDAFSSAVNKSFENTSGGDVSRKGQKAGKSGCGTIAGHASEASANVLGYFLLMILPGFVCLIRTRYGSGDHGKRNQEVLKTPLL